MLRGVNKRVIEITSTDSDYFERVILIVKKEHVTMKTALLDKKAQLYVDSLSDPGGAPPALPRRRRAFRWLPFLTAAAAVLSVAAAALIFF